MKPKYLAMLSVVSLLTLSTGAFFQQPVAYADSHSTEISGGDFVTAEAPTHGTARIVTENGQRYLELDKSFQTAEAPDLFVYLHRSGKPESFERGEFLNLGRLRHRTGAQRFKIAEVVNLENYPSVVIRCQQFSVTMGYANLN